MTDNVIKLPLPGESSLASMDLQGINAQAAGAYNPFSGVIQENDPRAQRLIEAQKAEYEAKQRGGSTKQIKRGSHVMHSERGYGTVLSDISAGKCVVSFNGHTVNVHAEKLKQV